MIHLPHREKALAFLAHNDGRRDSVIFNIELKMHSSHCRFLPDLNDPIKTPVILRPTTFFAFDDERHQMGITYDNIKEKKLLLPPLYTRLDRNLVK